MRVNKFNSLSYFILTVTLLLGVFFRIYNLTIFKATIPFFIIVTGSYLFISGDKKNYFKLGLLVILLGKEANQYTYILLTVLLFNTKIFIPFRKPAKYLYLLLMVGFFSYLVNQVIEINLLAFPAFVGSFFLPASLFMVTYRYVDEEMKDDLIQYYMVLITILAVVAIIQFGTLGVTVDRLTGGTTSSHTLGFHMAVGFLLLFGKLFVRKTIKKFKPHEILLFTLIFPVMFLSDAKYLMGNMIIGSFSIFLFLYIRKWLRPIVIISVAVGAFLGINYIQNKYIQLSVKSEVDVSYVSIRFIDSAKLQLYLKTLYLPINEPTVFLIGSGPGTFLSRAANSRASDTMDKSVTIGEGQRLILNYPLLYHHLHLGLLRSMLLNILGQDGMERCLILEAV